MRGTPFALALLCSAAPVAGQQAAPEPEIVVYGERTMLTARAERVLTADDVAGYGLGTVGELLDEIARERGETTDQPLYLVNGVRVAGLGDVDSYPTEALETVQVLSEGSAARFGGSPNRRVVNVVLKRQLRTYVGRAAVNAATNGGWSSRTAELGLTDIRRPRRVNLTVRGRFDDALRESERDVTQPFGAATDLGRFRTLRPEVGEGELRLSGADRLTSWLDGSVDVRLATSVSRAGLGLDDTGAGIHRRIRSRSALTNIQLNGEASGWLLAFTGSYASDRRRTMTSSAGLNGSRVSMTSRNARAELSATRSLFDLPAGPLTLTLRSGFSRDRLSSASGNFAQSQFDLGAGMQLPIASAQAGALAPLGDLSLGIELLRSRFSDFGTAVNATYALQWRPADWLWFSGSINSGRTPPSVSLTGAPILATPGTRYLDPISGETVDVTEISGGNPDIGRQRSASTRLSVNLKPIRTSSLRLTADYMQVRNRDLVSILPPGNELIALAFPERFVRDSAGRLIQVDVRPVTFRRQDEDRLRSAAEMTVRLSPLFGAQDGGARLQLNAAHSWLLRSNLNVRRGLEPVDLLSPRGVGVGGAGRSRHEYDLTVGYSERGVGLRINGQRRSKSFLNLASGADENVLVFAARTVVDVRAFVEGQRLLPAAQWARGARLSLAVSNVANSRQRVTDSLGDTPLRYQPGYTDPTGRTVQVELRKAF